MRQFIWRASNLSCVFFGSTDASASCSCVANCRTSRVPPSPAGASSTSTSGASGVPASRPATQPPSHHACASNASTLKHLHRKKAFRRNSACSFPAALAPRLPAACGRAVIRVEILTKPDSCINFQEDSQQYCSHCMQRPEKVLERSIPASHPWAHALQSLQASRQLHAR